MNFRFMPVIGMKASACLTFVTWYMVAVTIALLINQTDTVSAHSSLGIESASNQAQSSPAVVTPVPTLLSLAEEQVSSQQRSIGHHIYLPHIVHESNRAPSTDFYLPPTSTPVWANDPEPTSTPIATSTPLPSATSTPIPAEKSAVKNLAIGQPVVSSSVANGSTARDAIDGVAIGDFALGSVFKSEPEANPWWQVDLFENESDAYTIHEIIIYPRTDCCREQLNDFYLFVSNTDMGGRTHTELLNDPNVWVTQWTENDLLLAEKISLSVSAIGRYVRIQRLGSEQTVAMAEVVVMGEPLIGDQALLQISQTSDQTEVSEADGEPIIFTVQRYGPLAEASYQLTVVDNLSSMRAAEADPRIA
ncbi:MAG: discoidin domain-containing protein, partial [Chloroflexota bacterium]